MGYIHSVETPEYKYNKISIWSSMGRKRTSGVSHNKNSKTYKSSNRSIPSDSQTLSRGIPAKCSPGLVGWVFIFPFFSSKTIH